MRVPLNWLREHCDPGLGAAELAERLSMTGTEIERLATVGPTSAEGYVVGRVTAAKQHPDADRLSVCEVNTGDGTRTIVCGAPNVAAGQTVAVALPGAVLPGGQQLRKAKLRGVESDGMILSEVELEIGDEADGIMVLAEEGDKTAPAPGTPLGEALPLGEQVLEIEVTPNRPDCLGVYGVAREVHAATGAPLGEAPWEHDAKAEPGGDASDVASVTVECPDLCPRFTARVFEDVKVGPSPPWLQARLIAAGQRPISNVVDITNYVMLLTAQPLHAFDLDKVPGGELIVRTAAEGEKMTTLDGAEHVLDAETVVVADREQPSGIAGIKGGQVSEVSGETTRVLLEVANWNGNNILRTSSKLGLRSEASTRFEKQLHPELAMRAQRVASKLLVELCGAHMRKGTVDVAVDAPPEQSVTLRFERVEGLLGMEIEPERQREHLQRLGFDVGKAGKEALEAGVPPDRHYDVTREADLIEEVARIHGIAEHLPSTLPAHGERVGRLTREQQLRRRAEDTVKSLGFDEAITWSFVEPGQAERLLAAETPMAEVVRVQNPLSTSGSELRTSLLGGLLGAAQHNLARGADHVALFESGRVYIPQPSPADGGVEAGQFPGLTPAPALEQHNLGAYACGPLAPAGWRGEAPEADFFEIKGVLEVLLAELGADAQYKPSEGIPFLHPGRAASVEIEGAHVGWVGELHPQLANGWDVPGGVAFEVALAPVFAAATAGAERFEDVTSFPPFLEDIAVVAAREVSAAEISAAVLDAGGELLRSARVFDVYEGEQVGEGKRSLALRLEFAAPDRTLTDADVAERRKAIVAALGKLGGSLRE